MKLKNESPMIRERRTLEEADRPSILVVDDERAIRGLLEVFLRSLGYNVWSARGGRQALSIFQDHPDIRLVLLDVMMKDMSGPRTLLELQRLERDLSCCFMSADLGWYTVEQLRALGARHVFRKPFPLSELADVVGRLAGAPVV